MFVLVGFFSFFCGFFPVAHKRGLSGVKRGGWGVVAGCGCGGWGSQRETESERERNNGRILTSCQPHMVTSGWREREREREERERERERENRRDGVGKE